jgi:uncharacterized membrane protein YjjP (DUF1212 family)
MVQSSTMISPWSHFAVTYATALVTSGEATPQVESEVSAVLGARGIEATVMATPTALWVDVGSTARVIRTSPGNPRLDLQGTIRALGSSVARGELSPEEATVQLRAVMQRPAPYPAWAVRAAFASASAGAAVLMGGSLADVGVAGALGVVTLAVSSALGKRKEWEKLADPLAALVAATLAQPVLLLGGSPGLCALAAVIVLAPGLQLTLGMAEAAAGHWTSGAARLAGTLAASALLAAGLALPAAVLPPLSSSVAPVALPPLATLGATLAAALSVAVLCSTPPRQIPSAVLIALAAVTLTRMQPGPMGALGGALLATGLANAWRHYWPSSSGLALPALLLLVPGSVGVKGASLLLDQALLPGLETAVAAGIAAIALAAGILAGHALVPPVFARTGAS